MKSLKKTCIILFSLIILTSCNQSTYDLTSFTPSEKALAGESQLINRLQTMINTFDSISDTEISIISSEESEKEVTVVITTKTNKLLTAEQKEGIINLIADSVGDVDADNIYITENP